MNIPREVADEIYAVSVTLKSKMFPTGSRVISPTTVGEDSDWDYAVFADVEPETLEMMGYQPHIQCAYIEASCYYKSVGEHLVNLILCRTQAEYDFWQKATKKAIDKHCKTRPERLKVFEEVRAECQ